MSDTKSILITGGSSGIGAALAKTFADEGHAVFICGRRSEQLAQVAAGFQSMFFAECDVSAEADVKRFFGQVPECFRSIDVLIHCAAVLGPVGPVTEIDGADWFDAIKTDLFGAFLVIKYAVPLMRPERRPRILLLSGGGAFDPMPNLSAYGVSKAAIVRLAETLAVELAPKNIAVNVFAPGFVATSIFDNMLQAGPERGGELYKTVVKLLNEWHNEDIQLPLDCARFLISDAAAPLTGKTISARFDPWNEPEFVEHLSDIVGSRLYATQRTGLEHIKDTDFAEVLARALDRRRQREKRK